MRAPESTGKLDTVDTNPLPHVSSARAWDALGKKTEPSRPLVSLPKAVPVIREKPRAEHTEEICAEDILVIVPPRAAQPSSEELDDADLEIEVEHAAPVSQAPEFRPPAFSVHATQEVLADDVIEVANALPPPPPMPYFAPAAQQERPSSIPPPWTVDANAPADLAEFEFPTPPQYSGQHPAISARITAFSATQVFRRRSTNMKVVIASVSLAASVVLIAGIARLAPSSAFASSGDGPVGISVHAPKKLDSAVRGRTLAYGRATHVTQEVAAISIDSLPLSHSRRHY